MIARDFSGQQKVKRDASEVPSLPDRVTFAQVATFGVSHPAVPFGRGRAQRAAAMATASGR